MNCEFDPHTLTCPICGYVARSLPTYRRCHPVPELQWRPIDIGALVERWLVAVGITKDRVERWTRTAGRPGGCGCDGRKRWLTEYGNKAQRRIRGLGMRARRFCYGY